MTLNDKHIRLLQAQSSDLPTVLALLTRCDMHTSSVTLAGSTYWVAQLDGVPGGCIGLEHGAGASLIRSAAVAPEFRSRGLGRALALSALTHASLRGDQAVYLFSAEAGEYWQRFGFVPGSAAEVKGALPTSPQVKSGLAKGWIDQEQVWKLPLPHPAALPVSAVTYGR